MKARARRAQVVLAVLLLLWVDQAQAGGRFRLVPSLTLGQAYDDNVLSSSTDPEADWVTRADPGLEGEYRADALTISARYAFGAERFRDHPSLSRVLARQEGGFDIRGDATPRLRLSARGAYTQTQTPADLVLLGGLDLGRLRAERLDAATSMVWKASPQSEAALEYGFIRDRVATGLEGDAHAARLFLDRKATPRDTLRAGYTLRRFDWTDGPGATSHVVTVGWMRDLGPRARLGLSAGPRLAAGRPTALEAETTLRVGLRGGELALLAAQTEERVVGIAEPAVTQTVGATVGAEASRHFRLGLAVGLNRTRFDEGVVLVHRVGFEIGWRIAPWLALEAVPRWTRQSGGRGVTTFRDLDHRVLLLRLVTTVPGPRARPPLRPPGEEPRRPDAESEGSEKP